MKTVLYLVLASTFGACGAPGTPERPDASGAPDAGHAIADPADLRDQVIYLLLLDRFRDGDATNNRAGRAGCFDPSDDEGYHGGDLAGLRTHLDYLQELGVTAVWVTPAYRQTYCGYHGYWPAFADDSRAEVEPTFGSAAELTDLIEELHSRDMRFILDMIVNHAGYGAPIVQSRPDWFHSESDCESGPAELTCPLSGLPDFAQERAEVADYLTGVSSAWLSDFAIDGVRMDTAKHVPISYFAGDWIPAMTRLRPELFTIAEVFDESGPGALLPFLDAGFTSAFNFPLRRAIIDVIGRGQSTNRIGDAVHESLVLLGLDRTTRLINFVSNHDLPRWFEEVEPPGDDSEPDAAYFTDRYRLALVATFTLPGIPQLYYGDELGLRGRWPRNRRDMPAWAFDAQTRSGPHAEAIGDPARWHQLTRLLIALRRQHTSLQRGEFAELWRQNSGPAVYAFLRADQTDRVIVVINAGDEPSGDVAMPIADNPGIALVHRTALSDGTRLVDRLERGAPASAVIDNGHLTVALPPMTAAVYAAPQSDQI